MGEVIGFCLVESTVDGTLSVGEWTMEDQQGHNIEPSNFYRDRGSAERALAETVGAQK